MGVNNVFGGGDAPEVINIQVPNFFGFVARKADPGEAKESKEGNAEVLHYKNEFSELAGEFVNDVALFRKKYPVTTLASLVSLVILGVSNFFSFSFTGIVSSVIFCTVATAIGKSIGNDSAKYWEDLSRSIWECFKGRESPGIESADDNKDGEGTKKRW